MPVARLVARVESEGREMAYVYVNGSIVEESEAVISVLDHGLVAGDGIFEALAVYDGTPFAVRRHLERLARSAAGIRPLALDRVLRIATRLRLLISMLIHIAVKSS